MMTTYMFYHYVLLYFIPVSDEELTVVYVKYRDWEALSKDEAIARLARSYYKIVCEYLRSRDGDHLIDLAIHIESIMESQIASEVGHGRILEEYFDFIDTYEDQIQRNIGWFPMLRHFD